MNKWSKPFSAIICCQIYALGKAKPNDQTFGLTSFCHRAFGYATFGRISFGRAKFGHTSFALQVRGTHQLNKSNSSFKSLRWRILPIVRLTKNDANSVKRATRQFADFIKVIHIYLNDTTIWVAWCLRRFSDWPGILHVLFLLLFVALACHLPVLDGFDWHYQVSVHCSNQFISINISAIKTY